MSKQYQQKLLEDWEAVFQQGLLTFWVFVALRDEQLAVAEIQRRVAELTNGTYVAADQTLYRLLRKQYELELVDFVEAPGSGGPNKKLYTLSFLGKKLLKRFAERNISPFHSPEIITLSKKEDQTCM
ncbi:MAG: PadR family transcriptional regulator [Candidatus Saccharimonadales bacterium]